jgi:hypothetical protein
MSTIDRQTLDDRLDLLTERVTARGREVAIQ